MMTPRQQSLLDYFLDVARDLVQRGAVRQRVGESLLGVLKSEPRVVLDAVSEDFGVVLKVLGVGLVGGARSIALKSAAHLTSSLVSRGADALTEILADAIRGKKK